MSDSKSLIALCNDSQIGELQVRALLNVILTDVVLFFEVGKTMGREQVIQTADLIMEDYIHLKPEDFKLCFNRAKKGHYGKLYDRIDGQIILDWLLRYDCERCQDIESYRAKENRQLKEAEKGPLLLPEGHDSDQSRQLFTENINAWKQRLMARKLSRQKKQTREVQSAGDAQLSEVNNMVKNWIKQFDNLLARQRGKGVVRKYGMILSPFKKEGEKLMIPRTFTINEYLEYKQNQYNKMKLLEEALQIVGKKKLSKTELTIFDLFKDRENYEMYKDKNGNLAMRRRSD